MFRKFFLSITGAGLILSGILPIASGVAFAEDGPIEYTFHMVRRDVRTPAYRKMAYDSTKKELEHNNRLLKEASAHPDRALVNFQTVLRIQGLQQNLINLKRVFPPEDLQAKFSVYRNGFVYILVTEFNTYTVAYDAKKDITYSVLRRNGKEGSLAMQNGLDIRSAPFFLLMGYKSPVLKKDGQKVRAPLPIGNGFYKTSHRASLVYSEPQIEKKGNEEVWKLSNKGRLWQEWRFTPENKAGIPGSVTETNYTQFYDFKRKLGPDNPPHPYPIDEWQVTFTGATPLHTDNFSPDSLVMKGDAVRNKTSEKPPAITYDPLVDAPPPGDFWQENNGRITGLIISAVLILGMTFAFRRFRPRP